MRIGVRGGRGWLGGVADPRRGARPHVRPPVRRGRRDVVRNNAHPLQEVAKMIADLDKVGPSELLGLR